MKVTGTSIRRTYIGRAISIVLIPASAIVGATAWYLGLYCFAIINAFLFGINIVLAWINWFVFEI